MKYSKSELRPLHNRAYSEKLSIRKTKEKGRFVQTKSTIEKGELILVEKCQAAVPIFTQEFIPFCCQCFTSVSPYSTVACDGCSTVVYCSMKCKDEDTHDCGFIGNGLSKIKFWSRDFCSRFQDF